MQFAKSSPVQASARTLYEWHMRPGAFERLTPPWEEVRVLERHGEPNEPGARVVLSVPFGPFRPLRRRWVAEHRDIEPGSMFRDVQIEGPFARWEHTHRFRDEGSSSVLEDEIRFELPMGAVGRALGSRTVLRTLRRAFRYRHATTASDIETHLRYGELPRLRILLTGSSGLLGGVIGSFLSTGGHDVVRLVRRGSAASSDAVWDPLGDSIDSRVFEGVDAVVHLAGENIASGRWTAARKTRIRESRLRGTRLLAQAIAGLAVKPKVLVSASAIGFYGDRGGEILDEASDSGSGFLADVCRGWERATEPAERAGVRVVHLRTGIVLSPKGGALSRMLLPFRLGLGGVLGSGQQFQSWITADDLASVVLHALASDSLQGPLNAVSPNPVTNRELTESLARVLRRPAFLPAPRFALRAALGEMAEELLLGSARVAPRKLLESGYRFRHPELEGALRHVLGRGASR